AVLSPGPRRNPLARLALGRRGRLPREVRQLQLLPLLGQAGASLGARRVQALDDLRRGLLLASLLPPGVSLLPRALCQEPAAPRPLAFVRAALLLLREALPRESPLGLVQEVPAVVNRARGVPGRTANLRADRHPPEVHPAAVDVPHETAGFALAVPAVGAGG